jgi:hypothetical protein
MFLMVFILNNTRLEKGISREDGTARKLIDKKLKAESFLKKRIKFYYEYSSEKEEKN